MHSLTFTSGRWKFFTRGCLSILRTGQGKKSVFNFPFFLRLQVTRAISQKIRGLQHRARVVLSLGNTVFVDPMVMFYILKHLYVQPSIQSC